MACWPVPLDCLDRPRKANWVLLLLKSHYVFSVVQTLTILYTHSHCSLHGTHIHLLHPHTRGPFHATHYISDPITDSRIHSRTAHSYSQSLSHSDTVRHTDR